MIDMTSEFDSYKFYAYFILFSTIMGAISLPIINRFARSIVSPYRKANEFKRLLASAIDFFFCSLFYYLFVYYKDIYALAFGLSYILFKDVLFRGRSFGKVLLGLIVIKLSDGKPCSISQSILRNTMFVIPGINIASLIFEIALIIKDKQGIRLGDKFAQTQVVEGKEAPELTKFFQIIISYYKELLEKELPKKEVEEP